MTSQRAVITTRLPPQMCGVGSYSWELHQHWPASSDVPCFLVMQGAADSARALGYRRIEEFNGDGGRLHAGLSRCGATRVELHYAGRAYDRFGCPSWLPHALARWKRDVPDGHLAVFFHELPGKLPVTSHHFWTGLLERRIVGKLAALADVILTNTAEHARYLRQLAGRDDIHVQPVGSNIPVGDRAGAEKRAQTEFAILGLPFGRWQTLRMFDREISAWQRDHLLTRLHLIGPADARFDREARQCIRQWPDPGAVIEHGMLPAEAVSKVLLQVRFGLSNIAPTNWSKSGVFMAYAAHRCAVVSHLSSAVAPLCYVVAPDEIGKISGAEVDTRTASLRQWYEHNCDWNIIASNTADLLAGKATQEVAR